MQVIVGIVNTIIQSRKANSIVNEIIMPEISTKGKIIIICRVDFAKNNFFSLIGVDFNNQIFLPSIEIVHAEIVVIETQKLVKYGLNKTDPKQPYVLIDGWAALGTFLGIVSVTKVIDEIRDKQGRIKGYKARATLYRNPIMENGEIVGGTILSQTEASATKEGFQKDTSSMMSMAQTRALGKAYRMALGWIMKMADYDPTPAEERPSFKDD